MILAAGAGLTALATAPTVGAAITLVVAVAVRFALTFVPTIAITAFTFALAVVAITFALAGTSIA